MFNVIVYFSNGNRVDIEQDLTLEEAKRKLSNLCDSAAAKAGILTEIRVENRSGVTFFLAENVHGRVKVVWPYNYNNEGNLCHG